MKIMAFDLSSTCIGCVAAEISDSNVVKIFSTPIIPPKFDASSIGFMKSKKKIKCKNTTVSSWVKPGETEITKGEANKRNVLVRNEKDLYVISYISKSISDLIDSVKPDLVLVEKNEIFNGVLTSVLLGKIMGVLQGVCGSKGISVKEFPVKIIRKPYRVELLTAEFIKGKTTEELCKIPDISKRVIRSLMERKYNMKFLYDDESDACLVLDYYLNYVKG